MMTDSQFSQDDLQHRFQEWSLSADTILTSSDHQAVNRWAASVSLWLIDVSRQDTRKMLQEGFTVLQSVYNYNMLLSDRSEGIVLSLVEVARAALNP